ncbi:MAG: ParB/RepB/Spo0J family partition protein [Bacteroidetes bacterium]|nr:ParB/RepB/Spo0J family partition protein [Bacteroidota bacterium]
MDISNVIEIRISDIKLDGANVRSDLNSPNSQEGLQELADNIKINGLLQPIVLRGVQGAPPYDVIVGQRRFLAHKILKHKTIKAIFSGNVSDIEAILLSLSENMCRQEMRFDDISSAITKLYTKFGKDERKVKEHTGFSIRTIRTYVKIEEQATPKIKKLLSAGKVSMYDAKRVVDASFGDSKKADVLIDAIAKLSNYEKKRLVESGSRNPKANASEILKEAKQPKLEETVILNLPRKVHKALVKAAASLSVEVEELTINTIVNWLKTNDFLVD